MNTISSDILIVIEPECERLLEENRLQNMEHGLEFSILNEMVVSEDNIGATVPPVNSISVDNEGEVLNNDVRENDVNTDPNSVYNDGEGIHDDVIENYINTDPNSVDNDGDGIHDDVIENDVNIDRKRDQFHGFIIENENIIIEDGVDDGDVEIMDTVDTIGDNTAENNEHNTDQQVVGEAGKRKKKVNKRAENRKKSLHGEEHQTRKGVIKRAKTPRPNVCNDSCHFRCKTNFTEEQRKEVCSNFWNLGNYTDQKNFILQNVEQLVKKRTYTANPDTKRNYSREYHLQLGQEKERVCKVFFLSTLDISEKKVSAALKNINVIGTAKPDKRGRHVPKNKTDTDNMDFMMKYIMNLPAVPSHYTRASSTKKYLPTDCGNLVKLYKMYVQHCTSENRRAVGEGVFKTTFRQNFNIGFHKPKKDKCNVCESYKNTPVEERTVQQERAMKLHNEEKDVIKATFKSDQEASNNNGHLCTTFDLQKVLNTPYGKNNMLLYYSRKYSYLNFTVYESKTQNTFCYLWGECDGKRGSNEICTFLYKYIQKVDTRGTIKSLSLYCDSCSGQNKNRQIVSMLYYALQRCCNLKTITLTFLLPGHTMMPVDSVHACIENELKNKTVWAPSEWATIITNSRSKPRPYEVDVIKYQDFYDWTDVKTNLWPAPVTKKKKGDGDVATENVKIKQSRRVEMTKDSDSIHFYYGLHDDVTKKTIKVVKNPRHKRKTRSQSKDEDVEDVEVVSPKPCYSAPLPISKAKHRDLLDLCRKKVIPSRYHQEFVSMASDLSVPDVLAETDEEDE